MLDVAKSTPHTMPNYSGGVSQTHSEGSQSTHSGKFLQPQMQQTTQNLKADDIPKLTEELNEVSKSLDVDVKFAFNEKLGEVYINVVDKNSGEVIRKLPSEEAMKLKEAMKELVGSLLDTKG